LDDGVRGNPLEAIMKTLPEDYTKGAGRVTPELLVDMLMYDHYAVGIFNLFPSF
jgi:hypothetical protein